VSTGERCSSAGVHPQLVSRRLAGSQVTPPPSSPERSQDRAARWRTPRNGRAWRTQGSSGRNLTAPAAMQQHRTAGARGSLRTGCKHAFGSVMASFQRHQKAMRSSMSWLVSTRPGSSASRPESRPQCSRLENRVADVVLGAWPGTRVAARAAIPRAGANRAWFEQVTGRAVGGRIENFACPRLPGRRGQRVLRWNGHPGSAADLNRARGGSRRPPDCRPIKKCQQTIRFASGQARRSDSLAGVKGV
jgi:hypothetical protein